MTRRELDAAGISRPELRRAYQSCRELNARHGRTYFLATRMLTPAQRPAIHALYGFARRLDDLVDEPTPGSTVDSISAELRHAEHGFFGDLADGRSDDPLRTAVIDTVNRYGIAENHFRAFFTSMRMDLTVTSYPNRVALEEYMYGSAEVIGLQVLPVLGTVVGREDAAPHAAALGKAFQLTNFLRDVAEDLARGRVYLPTDELDAEGVDRDRLGWCARTRRIDPPVRRAIAAQAARIRAVYAQAKPGIAMLHPVSRPCVSTAYSLYSGILDRIEAADYNVFAGRVRVPRRARLFAACNAFTQVQWARYRQPVS
ncbi:phytoene/squalene synthase family protein [Amycolatopsis jiangsuensis]|uniref:Phytoene synthase n=1 Tax=Amycolatopsis jiangsuensis TaxID=1181879 RepID=A0A840IZ92_9PSEU|nr:phytoene/squalene synthase family protein [Amycolatopsis jiangsuensis]MBB4686735.1 phytoene synthase [Amycolatopsis jiangsuensis]